MPPDSLTPYRDRPLDDLRDRPPDPRLSHPRRTRRGEALSPRPLRGACRRPRPGRRRLRGDDAARPPRQARLAGAALGARAGRAPGPLSAKPRPCPVREHQGAPQGRPTRRPDCRAQARAPLLPRPARTRTRSSLRTRTLRTMRDMAPPNGQARGELLVAPGTPRAAHAGVSRRDDPNPPSRAA